MHNNLFLELRTENPEKYKSISVEQRLSITLRHLATGETQESLHYQFRVGQSTISGIIKETCKAIYEVLHSTYLRVPASEEEWRAVAADYGSRWNYFNCVGAMDGKHVRIDPPIQSGSMFYNYKENFSIVLLAIVDAQLRFLYIDVGTNGRVGDKGVWNKSDIRRCLDEKRLKIPPPAKLPNSDKEFPFVIVGDEGFNLSSQIMIPYPKEQVAHRKDRRIFNYRLSRARRCSENAFGVMVNRFQILRGPMRYDPDDAVHIVKAIICLHNLLRTDVVGRAMYSPPDMLDREDELTGTMQRGQWHDVTGNGMVNLSDQGGNHHARDALQLRAEWTEYFNGPGAVPCMARAYDFNYTLRDTFGE
ncbi:hypothetical protein FOCC_FOCC011161 [Frankliniella occidentalis]|nr:hypothetical protein FOCC_FOCC011161 [Frankliniella occidentalis]